MLKEERQIQSPPRFIWEVLLPIVFLVVVTVICRSYPVDRTLSAPFYEDAGGWMWKDSGVFRFIYNEGLLPAIYVVAGAMLVLLVGFHSHSVRRMRKVALYLVLVMVIGPGLIVNAVLKEQWGRPRPRDVTDFGGKERFEKVWEYDASSLGKSFPSGHASMGFFFFSAYFLLRGWGRRWALGTLATALILGSLLGFTRMVQGGHFFSDVVWSAGVCYFVSLGLYYGLHMHRKMIYDAEPKRFAPWQWGVGAVVLVGACLMLVAIPYHEEKSHRVSFTELQAIELPLYVDVELLRGDVTLSLGDSFLFESDVEAFGLPGSKVKDSFEVEERTERVKIRLQQKLRGYFPSIEQPAELTAPVRAELTEVATEKGSIVFDATGMRPGQRVKLKSLDGDVRVRLPDGLAVRVDLEKESKPGKSTKVTAKDLTWDESEQRWKRGDEDKAVIEVTVIGGRLYLDSAK